MTNNANVTGRIDDTVLRGVVAKLAADAPRHDREGSFPYEAFDLLFEAGILRLPLPKDIGGDDAGLAELCRVVEALAMGDPSVALVLSQYFNTHVGLARSTTWNPALKAQVQRAGLEGVALINSLRVEPELGTPARGGLPATVAERLLDGAGWRITGRKIYATGIPRLRWMIVFAKTDDPEPLVGSFLVPGDATGYTVEQTWDHLGMRATRSDDVLFNGTVVPVENAIGLAKPGPVLPDPRVGIANNLIISALYNGVARSARDWLVRYLNERAPANLGAPLATLPRFQSAVGEIDALLYTNAHLIHGAAAALDLEPDRRDIDTALVKLTSNANAIRAVEIGLSLTGNPGLSRSAPLERHLRDVLCSRIHTPQDDTILLATGRAALAAAAPATGG